MEYCLYETDIFDEDIGTKADQVISFDRSSYINGKAYKLTVKFHVDLLQDTKFEQVDVPSSITSKGTREDKISDFMSYQLDKVVDVLKNHDIESYSMSIEGDHLDHKNMIIIEMNEDTSKPSFVGRGKNKKRMKMKSIMPSRPFIQERASEHAAKRLGKTYADFMGVIRDKKIMAEILDIKPTEDDKKLGDAFVKQYGELWLTTKERESELLQQLENRALTVLNKYIERNESNAKEQ